MVDETQTGESDWISQKINGWIRSQINEARYSVFQEDYKNLLLETSLLLFEIFGRRIEDRSSRLNLVVESIPREQKYEETK